MVVFNTFDPFEGRRGHTLIVETVDARRPGSARLVEQVGLLDLHYPTIEAAYAREGGEPAWRETADVLVAELR